MSDRNAPKSRRWRFCGTLGLTGAVSRYEFPCLVSDRVAICDSQGRWGIWEQGGIKHGGGMADSRLAGFRAARDLLDTIADERERGIFRDVEYPDEE